LAEEAVLQFIGVKMVWCEVALSLGKSHFDKEASPEGNWRTAWAGL
jgi:hypothetical protein